MADSQILVSAGALCVAALVWLIRLEGRVNGHDLETKALREDVSYIRDRIDKALDSRR